MSTLKKRGQQVAAALLVTAGLAGVAYGMQRPTGTTESLVLTVPTSLPTATVLPSSTPAPIVVFVSGEVVSPNVYTLPPNSRVVDAITAAGGLTAAADASAVNQAILLEDGMQIHVPKAGEAATPLPLSEDPASGTEGAPQGKINVNTATLEELDTLPGIGPTTAEAIIRHRETNGAFESIDGLLEVPGIGNGKLAEIREYVTVE